jgi:sarcosine oxidase subunit gamma
MTKKGQSKMSNAVTALNGAKATGYITVTEAPLTGMITVRGDFNDVAFVNAIKSVCGAAIPAQRCLEAGTGCHVLWMSPDELLVVCAYDAASALVAALVQEMGSIHALVVNVSDARAVFDLQGDDVREVVAKLAPVDMKAMQIGELRRTRFSQVAAAFWMSSDTEVRVVCFRSVAEYVFNLLKQSSKPGFNVGSW